MMRVVILLCALLFAGCGGSLDPSGATRGFCFTLTSDDVPRLPGCGVQPGSA
jgi:hypothetical protein